MATENPIQPRPVGRPSDYKDEYADLLLAYFQMPAWDTAVDGKMVEGWFPTLAGFCCQIGVTQKTLWNWSSATKDDGITPKHEEFLLAYEMVKEYQQDYFTKGYMAGKYSNPAIGTLIAKNLLNWKDKQEVDQTVVAKVEVDQKVPLDFESVRKRMEAFK